MACSIHCATAYPCIGPQLTAFRMRRSSVPRSTSSVPLQQVATVPAIDYVEYSRLVAVDEESR